VPDVDASQDQINVSLPPQGQLSVPAPGCHRNLHEINQPENTGDLPTASAYAEMASPMSRRKWTCNYVAKAAKANESLSTEDKRNSGKD